MPFDYHDSMMLVLAALVLGMIAQNLVHSTYKKYAGVPARTGISASQAAQAILNSAGIYDVGVGRTRGHLTDHYNPRTRALLLSESVYDSSSIAALGVAAHEVGHAIQHAQGYLPLRLRDAIVPAVNFGSQASMPLLLIGLFLNSYFMALVGVTLYGLAVGFQLITLPVELDASRRALKALTANGILQQEEMPQARKVLMAAAFTYVASAFAAVAQLLRLMTIVSSRRDRR